MTITGFVDYITAGEVGGWAIDMNASDGRVIVEVMTDGEVIASGPACIYRGDLKAAGIGDGMHGFRIAFPDLGKAISCRVRGSAVELPRSQPASDLFEKSKAVGWFHSIDLGGGHFTNGHKTQQHMEVELAAWQFPVDFSEKTVLDIGCADGGWSITAIRRGARTVLSIDEQMTIGLRFLLENNVFPIQYKQIDLFSQEFMDLPTFDIIIFTGVLYHVQDPLEALKRVRTKVRELVILETHVNESIGTDVPYMIYYENKEMRDDPSTWWGPNIPCLEGMFRTAGFDATKVFTSAESARNSRVAYHLRPEKNSIFSKVTSSATGSHSMLEIYLDGMQRYQSRVVELESEIASLRQQLAR
jgi:tRNA (mo5U34)-methyltransferase